MDTIHIKGLRLFAYHGVNPEEKRDGQTFVLDLRLGADLSQARRSDRLEDAVNYAAVVKAVRAAFTAQSFDLIERAAQAVCDAVLEGFPQVEEVSLLLQKPEEFVWADRQSRCRSRFFWRSNVGKKENFPASKPQKRAVCL